MPAVIAPTEKNVIQSAGGRIVTVDGRELPLRRTHLSAHAVGGIARVVLSQHFENPFDEPLEVRYLLPLPSDGAVSGFSFTLDGERIDGEVTGRQDARERFEKAMVEGKTAALLEQDRTSLFSQRVGNVPSGSEIVAKVVVDQPLAWLEEGAWEWRFPTVVGPRYQGEPGRVADAGKLNVPVADGPMGVRASLALTIADALSGPVESASHALATTGDGPREVRFEDEDGVHLDRDVVVRWPVARDEVRAGVTVACPDTAAHDGDVFALLTVVPPAKRGVAVPRDLTFLIDTSGSMDGKPLEQAARVVAAMVSTLGPKDRFEMIEFGSRPVRWKKQPVIATESNKLAGIEWARKLRPSGCTEMHRAVLEALAPLRDGTQRQVVLITDGYIGFEEEIVHTLMAKLPKGARLHTVGVGYAVNRSLTQAAARAGRGSELIVGIDEDVDRLIPRLLARTTAPLVTDLVIEGPGISELAPRRLPDLFAGKPALIAARLAQGGGEVVLRGDTAIGAFEQRLEIPACAAGEGSDAIAALFAREKIEDLEMELSSGRGQRAEIERTIEDTGVAFQVASRLTSWIAVSRKATVDPRAVRRTVAQPHELPHGVSAEGIGLRSPVLADFGAAGDLELTGGLFSELSVAPPGSPMTTGGLPPAAAMGVDFRGGPDSGAPEDEDELMLEDIAPTPAPIRGAGRAFQEPLDTGELIEGSDPGKARRAAMGGPGAPAPTPEKLARFPWLVLLVFAFGLGAVGYLVLWLLGWIGS